MKKFKFIFIALFALVLSGCDFDYHQEKGTLIYNWTSGSVNVSIGDYSFVLTPDNNEWLKWEEFETDPVITSDSLVRIEKVSNYSISKGIVTKYSIYKSYEYKYEIKNSASEPVTVNLNGQTIVIAAGDTVTGSMLDESPMIISCFSGNYKKLFTQSYRDGTTYFYIY